MTSHALSTAVHSLEIEYDILCTVIDSAFARGVLDVKECRQVQGILHRRGHDTLTTGTIAKRIVHRYRDKVKSFKGPDGGKDGSFTRAVSHVETLLTRGYNYARLLYAVENYGRSCDAKDIGWPYRFNAANFFSSYQGRCEFKAYLPEGDVVLPDEDKAAKISGLFDGEDDE